MEKALLKLEQIFGTAATQFWKPRFNRIRVMKGANRVFNRISTAKNAEDVYDYLAEIRYALIFAGLEFQVVWEPSGRKGPDLEVLKGNDLNYFVEVKRFRKVHSGPEDLMSFDTEFILKSYGDPPRDIRKAFEKILEKLPQVGEQRSIIAIWNDDEALEELEVDFAVRDLCDEANQQIRALPAGLSFILYGSTWIRLQQLYCFPISSSSEAHETALMTDLADATVEELIQKAIGAE